MTTDTTHKHKADATDQQSDISTDDIYHVLSNQRRRDVLDHVQGHETIRKADLIDILTELEFGEGYTSDERKRIHVSLHQCHLPKLESMGVVEIHNERTIEAGPNAAVVERYRHDSRPGVLERVKRTVR